MVNVNFFPQFLKKISLNTQGCVALPTKLGISNGHKNFQLLAKFGLCSICSQNLDECSLARARKIFAIARMLGFSLKFARFLKIL